jgi:hypothetical protein
VQRLRNTFTDAAGRTAVFPVVVDPASGQTAFLTPPGTEVYGQPITENFRASGPRQSTQNGLVWPLLPNGQDRQATLNFARRTIDPDGSLVFISDIDQSFARTVPGGATVTTTYDYTFLVPEPQALLLPSPTTGGVIGRTKISEDNSPLPRDRVILTYDYFDKVPLAAQGIGVHRFSPGLEKTFFDRQASIEVRIPFAATLTSDILTDGSTTSSAAEFGNIAVTLKGLIYGSNTLNVAAGVGFAVPTADDTRVFTPEGVEIIRVKNETLVITPYWAYLYTPNESVFFQNWYALGFNTVGNRVLGNPDLKGLQPAGRLFDQHLLQIDAQLGYWLVSPARSDGLLTGLAPFVELHWNASVGGPTTVQTNQFTIGASNSNFNELNLSFGSIITLGNSVNLMVGAAFPLLNENNRTFDYQLGIRANVFFGPTLQAGTPQALVSAF